MAKTTTKTTTSIFEGVTTSFDYCVVDFDNDGETVPLLQITVHGYNKADGKPYSYDKFFEVLLEDAKLIKLACFIAKQSMSKKEEEQRGYSLYGATNGLIPSLQAKGYIGAAI